MPKGINETVMKMAKIKDPVDLGSKAPVITNVFAMDKGYYGCPWKIFLEAEDPDGDMEKIAVVVHQIGYGSYPTDWIVLKPQYQRHLIGFLQWNTFSSRAAYLPEWTQITVKVSIFDKAKNESNEIVLPFTFESGVKDQKEDRLPAPFDRGNLPQIGNITVDLFYEIK